MTLKSKFSVWRKWGNKSRIPGMSLPGVYVVAISKASLDGKAFTWLPEVVYIGMTNSILGLDSRLSQFENTIKGPGCHHGGADRVKLKHPKFSALSRKLFVAVATVKCNVATISPKTLKAMGRVAKMEYDCLAAHVELHQCLPEFNDKRRSKKYSKLGRKRKSNR